MSACKELWYIHNSKFRINHLVFKFRKEIINWIRIQSFIHWIEHCFSLKAFSRFIARIQCSFNSNCSWLFSHLNGTCVYLLFQHFKLHSQKSNTLTNDDNAHVYAIITSSSIRHLYVRYQAYTMYCVQCTVYCVYEIIIGWDERRMKQKS